MKDKIAYFLVGAVVWGGAFFVVARYVVDVHSGAALAGLTTGAAILGGLSAANNTERRK